VLGIWVPGSRLAGIEALINSALHGESLTARCFVNASYGPGVRNGTCPGKVAAFFVGYQWENGGSGRSPQRRARQSIGLPLSRLQVPKCLHPHRPFGLPSWAFLIDSISIAVAFVIGPRGERQIRRTPSWWQCTGAYTPLLLPRVPAKT